MWQPIWTFHAEVGGAALDHAPGVDPVHRRGREQAGAADSRAEEGVFSSPAMPAVRMYSSRKASSLWWAGIFVEAHPPALAVGEIILDTHRHHGADAGEGVGHDADQGAMSAEPRL